MKTMFVQQQEQNSIRPRGPGAPVILWRVDGYATITKLQAKLGFGFKKK